MSDEDLRLRKEEVEKHETEARQEHDAMMSTADKDASKKQQTRNEAEKSGTPAGKKKPSLYRPGEKPGSDQTPPDKPPKQ